MPSVLRTVFTIAAIGLFPLCICAQERINCMAIGVGSNFRCRIDEPNVRQRVSEYKVVRFQPGDRVTVRGGGCVQTGGSGRTWKLYVNPQGPNVDRQYHGLIQIPGAMPDLKRIGDLLEASLVIPASVIDPSQLYLRLGYEDDNYQDNGYWGHDDGIANQCQNMSNAFIEVVVNLSSLPTLTPSPTLLTCLPGVGTSTLDGDNDGIADSCEQWLAEKFAPILYHSSDESNYPTNVDLFLKNTTLSFYDDDCTPDLKVRFLGAPSQAQLFGHSHQGECGSSDTVFSNGTRSNKKQRTFFLEDVGEEFRIGSLNSSEWITYFHAYKNDVNGVTIQYWRLYAFNDAVNNHGGDWEGVHVVLDSSLRIRRLDLLGHTSIEEVEAAGVQWEGNHPRIYSEGGGHASRASGGGIQARGCPIIIGCSIDPNNQRTFIRQETWSGGDVNWFDGRVGKVGVLVNVGEKLKPLNGQVFIQYSGIWGSPGALFATSGYWGPAFNETDMAKDGFVTAWCRGMRSPTTQECYPIAISR